MEAILDDPHRKARREVIRLEGLLGERDGEVARKEERIVRQEEDLKEKDDRIASSLKAMESFKEHYDRDMLEKDAELAAQSEVIVEMDEQITTMKAYPLKLLEEFIARKDERIASLESNAAIINDLNSPTSVAVGLDENVKKIPRSKIGVESCLFVPQTESKSVSTTLNIQSAEE